MNRKDESSVPVISSARHAALRTIAPPLIGLAADTEVPCAVNEVRAAA